MKRFATLLLSLPLVIGSLLAVTTPAAHAATCTTVAVTSNSYSVSCSGGGRFRAFVHCRRPSSSRYDYYSYGPVRNSGGTSRAVCDQANGDYRDAQGVQFV